MVSGDQPRVGDCHCFAARKTARQISRLYDARLQPTGLRITQFLTLLVLNEKTSATMAELAEHLDIEPTAMGKMVGTLERDGLVAVRKSPTDGRSRVARLTADGHSIFERAIPLWREAQQLLEEIDGNG